MDTGTHLVMGLGLAGLAHVDPAVASNSHISAAILAGTVIGSQAPDFDSILRMKGNAFYIRNHRGLSHSLPAIALWSLLISGVLYLVFPNLPMDHVLFWVFVSVFVHVLTDLFNPYGTQVLRPITDKWIAWNVIHIFDPVIFFSHLIAIFLWAFGLQEPHTIFPVLYGFLVVYFIWRTWEHRRLEKSLPEKDSQNRPGDKYVLIPTFYPWAWNVVKKRPDGSFALGDLKNGSLRWVDHIECAQHPAVEVSKKNPDVASLLHLSDYACPELKEHEWGYEVRWMDVRYRHRRQFLFIAVALFDKNLRPLDSYVGWVSESRLEKKLGLNQGTDG